MTGGVLAMARYGYHWTPCDENGGWIVPVAVVVGLVLVGGPVVAAVTVLAHLLLVVTLAAGGLVAAGLTGWLAWRGCHRRIPSWATDPHSAARAAVRARTQGQGQNLTPAAPTALPATQVHNHLHLHLGEAQQLERSP